jgi:hypothetical protein
MHSSNKQKSIRREMMRIWLTDAIKFSVFALAVASIPFMITWLRGVLYGIVGAVFIAYVVYGLTIDVPRTSIVLFAGEPGEIRTPVRSIVFTTSAIAVFWTCMWLMSRSP